MPSRDSEDRLVGLPRSPRFLSVRVKRTTAVVDRLLLAFAVLAIDALPAQVSPAPSPVDAVTDSPDSGGESGGDPDASFEAGGGADAEAPGDDVAPEPPSRRPICSRCSGRKTLPCTRCEEKGLLVADCPACEGSGKVECSREGCFRGAITCPACKGRGSARKKIIPLTGRPYIKTIICGHCKGKAEVDCFRCEGGQAPCPTCEGKKAFLIDCEVCGGDRKVDCEVCAATGRGPLADLSPAVQSQLRDIRGRAETLIADVDESQKALESARQEHAAATEAFRRIEEKITEITSASMTADMPSSLRRIHDRIISGRRRHEELFSVCDDSLEQAEELLGRQDAVTGELTAVRKEIDARLEDPLESETVEPVAEVDAFLGSLRPAEAYAQELAQGLRSYRFGADSLAGDRSALETEIRSWEEELSRHRAQRRKEAAAAARLREKLESIESAMPDIARRSGLPEDLGLEFDPASMEDDIRIAMVILAREEELTERTDGLGLPRPADELLEAVPGFISSVFEFSGDIRELRLLIRAPVLDETGHPVEASVQSFSFFRDRWERLVTGAFASEWRVLLSLSEPTPDLPEESEAGNEGVLGLSLPVVLAVGIGALALVYVLVRLLAR